MVTIDLGILVLVVLFLIAAVLLVRFARPMWVSATTDLRNAIRLLGIILLVLGGLGFLYFLYMNFRFTWVFVGGYELHAWVVIALLVGALLLVYALVTRGKPPIRVYRRRGPRTPPTTGTTAGTAGGTFTTPP